ncbi:MAG TPA: GNAT family N-acetyltransferase [Pirellulales bacterium]|nr:GNAT family N-acetyltransferase [Pirellulales bacterium]
MTTTKDNQLHVGPVANEHRGEAIQLLFPGQTLQMPPGCLIEARRDNRLVAVTLAVSQATSGEVWSPRCRPDESPDVAQAVVRGAVAYLAELGCRVVHATSPAAMPNNELWRASGFERLATLEYLSSLERDFPTSPPRTTFGFVPFEANQFADLAKLVERTYEATRDCPALGTRRSAAENLADYQAVDGYSPALWSIAVDGSVPIGCVLLMTVDGQGGETLELSYMGLVPEQRGRGHGFELVEHAQWRARQLGKSRLVLAVDCENAPAVAVYRRRGFLEWDRRVAWMSVLSR